MKTNLFTLLFAFCLISAVNPPKGLYEYQKAEGDLNGDGKNDLVAVYAACKDETACENWEKDEPPQVEVQIFLSQEKGSDLKAFAISPKSACYGCGGVNGSKITGVAKINKNGVLEMSYAGGSRERWERIVKWRLDKKSNEMKMIGTTFKNDDMAEENKKLFSKEAIGSDLQTDINYASGKLNKIVVGKDRKPKTVHCAVDKSFLPPSFEKFDFENFDKDGSESCK